MGAQARSTGAFHSSGVAIHPDYIYTHVHAYNMNIHCKHIDTSINPNCTYFATGTTLSCSAMKLKAAPEQVRKSRATRSMASAQKYVPSHRRSDPSSCSSSTTAGEVADGEAVLVLDDGGDRDDFFACLSRSETSTRIWRAADTAPADELRPDSMLETAPALL